MFIKLNPWVYMFVMILMVVGSLNWLSIGAFNVNFVDMLTSKIPNLNRVIYVLVGIAALLVLMKRDFYLPFLGKTVFPCSSLIPDKVPDNADISVSVKVRPGARVIYWASETDANKELVKEDPWTAYSKYENAGLVTADNEGNAVLKVRSPSSYKVPGILGKRTLDKHIHYRICGNYGNEKDVGMLSRVMTAYL
jgi:uncharacterized membrane protein YuzA (DUF378 family)